MQRKFGIDLADERLEAVHQFAVPGDEGGTVMHMRVGVDLILLEPVADSTHHWRVAAQAGIVVLGLQLDDRVAQPVALLLADCRKVAANSVTECHGISPC